MSLYVGKPASRNQFQKEYSKEVEASHSTRHKVPHHAVFAGSYYGEYTFIQLLLPAKANPNISVEQRRLSMEIVELCKCMEEVELRLPFSLLIPNVRKYVVAGAHSRAKSDNKKLLDERHFAGQGALSDANQYSQPDVLVLLTISWHPVWRCWLACLDQESSYKFSCNCYVTTTSIPGVGFWSEDAFSEMKCFIQDGQKAPCVENCSTDEKTSETHQLASALDQKCVQNVFSKLEFVASSDGVASISKCVQNILSCDLVIGKGALFPGISSKRSVSKQGALLSWHPPALSESSVLGTIKPRQGICSKYSARVHIRHHWLLKHKKTTCPSIDLQYQGFHLLDTLITVTISRTLGISHSKWWAARFDYRTERADEATKDAGARKRLESKPHFKWGRMSCTRPLDVSWTGPTDGLSGWAVAWAS